MVNRGVGRDIIWADKRSPISGEGGKKEVEKNKNRLRDPPSRGEEEREFSIKIYKYIFYWGGAQFLIKKIHIYIYIFFIKN